MKMKFLQILLIACLLLHSAVPSMAEDIIFFEDDHYKSIGQPVLVASAVNPSLEPGKETVLQISLANIGRLEELMPINESGPKDDILQEMKAEMNGSDAFSINAVLRGKGPIRVDEKPVIIDVLASGRRALLQFNVTAEKNTSGWHDLLLEVSWERQVDVSVRDGLASPLFEAEKDNITIPIFLTGNSEPLKITGISSSLYPGASGSLMAAIENDGQAALHNCTARLLTVPPFFSEDAAPVALGELLPGSLAVAAFSVRANGDAAASQDYQLGCEICCNEKKIISPLTITLKEAGIMSLWPASAIAASLALLAALAWRMRGKILGRSKKRRRIKL